MICSDSRGSSVTLFIQNKVTRKNYDTVSRQVFSDYLAEEEVAINSCYN